MTLARYTTSSQIWVRPNSYKKSSTLLPILLPLFVSLRSTLAKLTAHTLAPHEISSPLHSILKRREENCCLSPSSVAGSQPPSASELRLTKVKNLLLLMNQRLIEVTDQVSSTLQALRPTAAAPADDAGSPAKRSSSVSGVPVYFSHSEGDAEATTPIYLGKKVTPARYAKICHLNAKSHNLLAETSWIQWAFFVCYHSTTSPMELHEILYSAMTDIFSHQDLNNIFVKALEDPHTVQLANALLECRWSYDRKETHKMLAKVNPYNFFSNHFKEFVGYIRSQNRDQDELVYTFLELKVLTEFYGEDLLAQILVLPKNQIVRGWTYLNALTTVWLGEKKSPVEVMKTVDDDVYNFLYYGADKFSPKLCFSYNSKFYKVYPSEVTMTSLDTLTSAVGPARVAIMLDIAQKSPNSFGKSQGLVYQNTQYQEWYAKKLSPDDVYEMIENDLMKNPWGLSDASDLAESVRIRYTSALLHPDFTKNKELVV